MLQCLLQCILHCGRSEGAPHAGVPHPHACAGVTRRVRPAVFFYNRSEIRVKASGEATIVADAPERHLPPAASADAAAAVAAVPAFGFDLELMRAAERSRRIIDELGGVAALAKVDDPLPFTPAQSLAPNPHPNSQPQSLVQPAPPPPFAHRQFPASSPALALGRWRVAC